MIDKQDFNILNSRLEGANLIEASAGTGKTYTIAGLFLRLVIEMNLSVNEILVVTFTEAATEELKGRIRTKLRQAVEAFSDGHSKDSFLNGLQQRNENPQIALRALREALRTFDQASIFTIHGFCRRMLHENAFESGSLFDTDLVTDQENLKGEIVDDFWRKHFYKASPLFVNYAIEQKFNPGSLFSLIGGRVGQPYLKIIPQVEIPNTSRQENEFKEAFDEVCKAWSLARAEVEIILTTDEGLNRNKYRKTSIPFWIQNMGRYVTSHGHSPSLFNGFEKFTSSELKGSVKKNYTPPFHTFFELCETLRQKQEELENVFDQFLLGLKAQLFSYMEDELIRRKGEKNILFFDDLLLKLHRALNEKGGDDLARVIRMKFKAALIDEFQDTDPIQYSIFQKIFGTEDRLLFLIGDPKQAIYSFRGADVFAYMAASGDVKSQHTLRENWRSDPDLITAINSIFAKADRPFVYDKISFQPTAPATGKDHDSIRLNGKSEPPMQLWFLDVGEVTETGKAIGKARARELISESVAGEISRLLDLGRKNQAILGKRPLMEGDIAVLVRTNAEAHLIQKALSGLNILSVLYATGNLFDSHEALEMERLLFGIADPANERRIKVALTTDIMGVSGDELDRLMEDETGWEKSLAKFRMYHNLWNESGFFRMFRYILLQEKALPRLMSFPDGERRNTNLLHLTELIHQTSIEKKLSMEGLLKWLSEQRNGTGPMLEEHPLRLESDENAVKIVTIHKSKGLEYPVVFCPFLWGGSMIKRSKDTFMFHDEADNMRLTLDLGSKEKDKNRVFAEKELLAENLRLLYVALTRAKNRCYMVWGRFNEAETSAPAYLFHKPESLDPGNIVSATGQRFKGLKDEDVFTELKTTIDRAGGTIQLSEMPVGTETKHFPLPGEKINLSCRKFSGDIDRQWHVSSFSSLTSNLPHSEEMADRDIISPQYDYDQNDFEKLVAKEPPTGIFSFPKGAKAGVFIHDLLEHLDFAEKNPDVMKSLVADKLKQYSFESQWLDTIYDMIKKILSASLDPVLKGLKLSSIQNNDRLNELEFYFPLKTISPEKIKWIFHQKGFKNITPAETIGRLKFFPTKGFMKGFMDLVFQWHDRFYLVDWKSNFLGDRIEDYGQESLELAMKKEFYVLQYHIYTLALDQYLNLRLPNYSYKKHFGGVFYIFLRGVDPKSGPDYGIYRDLPSPELIAALRKELIPFSRIINKVML